MAHVVVTVPKKIWPAWLAEGDAAGEPYSGNWSYFRVANVPKIEVGERVYVVSHGKLRGYAPLVAIARHFKGEPGTFLVRAGGAVACTIPYDINGFQGYRYIWWSQYDELPFPDWRVP